MKICCIVGHSKRKQGASNKRTGLTEFSYNESLVLEIGEELARMGHNVNIVYRQTYKQLPHDINTIDADVVVSFHCNAYNEKASGTEVLYAEGSDKGKKAAQIFHDHIVDALKLTPRGIKPKRIKDRGGYILHKTKAPCIILETFFLDNDLDLECAIKKHDKLVQAIVGAFHLLEFVYDLTPKLNLN